MRCGPVPRGARRVGRSLPRFERTGCPLDPKHTAALLFWMRVNGSLAHGARATTAPDYLVRCLTRGTHALDPTIAHGWGIYDVAGGDWDRAALCAAVATGAHATVREASAALLGHEHSC